MLPNIPQLSIFSSCKEAELCSFIICAPFISLPCSAVPSGSDMALSMYSASSVDCQGTLPSPKPFLGTHSCAWGQSDSAQMLNKGMEHILTLGGKVQLHSQIVLWS